MKHYPSLQDCGSDWQQFLQCEDDEFVFTMGACHAFALALRDHFGKLGRTPEPYFVKGSPLRHVLVKLDESLWDVTGHNTPEAVAQRWCGGDQTLIKPLGNWDRISTPGNHFGAKADEPFLSAARERADRFIKKNPDRFGSVIKIDK